MNPESKAACAGRPFLKPSEYLYVLTFAGTLFCSALLLFGVQPLLGKMLLPRLGGTPQVWNACMVFFQAMLFAGYLHAHYSGVLLGRRRQAVLHLALAVAALLALPLGLSSGTPALDPAQPLGWLMQTLLLSVGLPIFVISSTAPLVQQWFSRTRHPSADDPYFLYAASNLGSLLALLGYPLIIEPLVDLDRQASLLSAGFVVLVMALSGCALLYFRDSDPAGRGASPIAPDGREASLAWRLRARWLLLSFAPSSLMLGVTTHITTDIAAVPLFWVLPLALYLLSFVLVFMRRPPIPHDLALRGQAILVTLLVVVMLLPGVARAWPMLVVHLLAFFATAMVCHGELIRTRPAVQHVTEFYLWLSAGGLLGGVFNALLAPLAFSLPLEYPLVLVLACLLRPPAAVGRPMAVSRLDLLLPLALAVAMLLAGQGMAGLASRIASFWWSASLVVLAALSVLSFSERPVRYALGIAAVLVNVAALGQAERYREGQQVDSVFRSFFGVYQVRYNEKADMNVLIHGTTVHGAQLRQPALSSQPILYYGQGGPFGGLFQALADRLHGGRVAVVGLGVGGLTCYGTKRSAWTFYEIDPLVERIARDTRYFSYLRDCPPAVQVVIGDARLSLRAAPDHYYNLIVVDAFSSDAIPTHLLTSEAIAGYLAKLTPDGVLAIHISNRYMDLEPTVGTLAGHAGLVGRINRPRTAGLASGLPSTPAQLAVLGRSERSLGPLATDPGWRPLSWRPGDRVWSDRYVNVLASFRWTVADQDNHGAAAPPAPAP